MPDCPTCDKELNTELGVKQHHTKVHGESLVERDCKICNKTIKPYKGNGDRKFCSRDCFQKWQKDRHQDKWITVECSQCGKDKEMLKVYAEKHQQHFCSNDCQSQWKSENWNGENHPNWVEENTVECKWCGDEFRADSYRREMGGNFCSYECHYEWRRNEWESPTGEDHWNWKGGHVEYGKNWYEMRRKIRERDNICQKCGEDGEEELLDVHHIIKLRKFDNPEDANTMDNLILLCRPCHIKTEFGDGELVTQTER